VPGAVRGYGGKFESHPADAIGPARFPGARLIEADRHHPRGILSGAAFFVDPTEINETLSFLFYRPRHRDNS
jgi:hypothetical protein